MDTEQVIKAEKVDGQNESSELQFEHFLAVEALSEANDTEEAIVSENAETEKNSPVPDTKEESDPLVLEDLDNFNKPYGCNVCQKRFKQESTLFSHMTSHTGTDQNTIVCTEFLDEIFGEESINVENLKEKLKLAKTKRSKEKKPFNKTFKCMICDKGYSHKETLLNHMKKHTGGEPYSCAICGKSFSKHSFLKEHQVSHAIEDPNTCVKCGQTFADPYQLNTHMTSHVEEKPKPFKCPQCDRGFTLRNTLERHITTHSDAKPFSCSTCGKCFSLERALKGHMVIHTGLRAYECTTCGRNFSHNSSLKNHMRLHTGEKPFLCTTCGKTFVQQSSLSKHLVVHSGEKPFLCSLCGKGFKRNNHLTKHMKKIHKDLLFGTRNFDNNHLVQKDDILIDRMPNPYDSDSDNNQDDNKDHILIDKMNSPYDSDSGND